MESGKNWEDSLYKDLLGIIKRKWELPGWWMPVTEIKKDEGLVIDAAIRKIMGKGNEIECQIRERKVICIKVKEISHFEGLLTLIENGFLITINSHNPNGEWPIILGHELCHTFFHEISLSSRPFRWLSSRYRTSEERFCENFAFLWAKLNQNQLDNFLEKLAKNKYLKL